MSFVFHLRVEACTVRTFTNTETQKALSMATRKNSHGTGSLFKRGKKGIYYIQYYADGKRKATRLIGEDGKSITDKRKAEAAAKSFLAPLQETTRIDQLKAVKAKLEGAEQLQRAKRDALKPAIPLSEVWNEYIASQNRPKSGKSTLKRYKAVIGAFIEWIEETFPAIIYMKDVKAEHAEAYAIHLEANNLSPSSFNIYLNNLTTIWATLARKASLEANPFAWDKKTRTGIERRNIKAETTVRKKRALSLKEVNTVIEKAEGDYRTLLIILVCTGQRLVDGLKLRWVDIDLESGIITLIPKKTASRTGKQVYIPILPQLRLELESKSHYGRYVLPDLVEDYERDPSIISKKIRSIFTAADLNAHKETNLQTSKAIVETGAHSLRHSFVSIARLAGVPDAVIQTITGHESLDMVDHYTSITPEAVKALSASMPTGLPGQKAEKKKEPMPDWIRERLETLNSKNWNTIKKELLENAE
jgi:integrase